MGRWALVSALLLGALSIVAAPLLAVLFVSPTDQAQGQFYWDRVVPAMWIGWLTAYAAASVCAVREAVLQCQRKDLDRLRRSTVWVKVAGIPFFVLNWTILSFFVMGTAFFGIGIVLAPLFVVGTYVVLLPTSAFGLAALMRMRRDGLIDTGFFALHTILHLVFVLDVISTLIVAERAKQVLVGAWPVRRPQR